MEVKLREKIKAAVEIDGQLFIDFSSSLVYENIGKEEAFIYVKSIPDTSTGISKEIKIRFLKAQ